MAAPIALHKFDDETTVSVERINENNAILVAAINALSGAEVLTVGNSVNGNPDYVPVAGGRFIGQIVAPSVLIGPEAGPLHPVLTKNDTANQTEAGIVKQMVAIADLAQTISDPPTKTQVQAISSRVDALLAALRAAGMLSS